MLLWDAILHAIREAHKDDTDSAPDGSNAMKLIKDAKKALSVPGSYLDVFTALMCTQLQIRYEKLSEQEHTVWEKVVSRIMRKIVCRLWQNKISQQ